MRKIIFVFVFVILLVRKNETQSFILLGKTSNKNDWIDLYLIILLCL